MKKTTGQLILQLRKEMNLTQKQLADTLCISDKTVSKWERDMGLPDISLIDPLAKALCVDQSRLLAGELGQNHADIGNMKRLHFYLCPHCGNLLTSTTHSTLSCCGRPLTPLEAQPCDPDHAPQITQVEYDDFITFSHPMSKDHFISFVAWVTDDRVLLVKLYPEQNAQVRFAQMRRGKLYFYCTRHGLFVK